MTTRAPHSSEYFGVARQYWWNYDFLALMSQRWRLDRVTRALDVGCGLGHWMTVLATYLPPEAELVGLDREERWLAMAKEVASAVGENVAVLQRATFQQGVAESLPFPDGSFDMVTCQTLLIHVPDAGAVIEEMKRVLQPGGLLVVVEPNNLVQALMTSSVTEADDLTAVLDRVRLQLMCERGRRALGEGDFSIGERIPALLTKLGWDEVQVFQSDRALPLLPPYRGPEQAAMSAALLGEGFHEDAWLFGREDATRYFLGAGGSEQELARLWENVTRTNVRERDAVRAQTFARAGGRAMYLVSGRKAR